MSSQDLNKAVSCTKGSSKQNANCKAEIKAVNNEIGIQLND
jgi:hypothetical protein